VASLSLLVVAGLLAALAWSTWGSAGVAVAAAALPACLGLSLALAPATRAPILRGMRWVARPLGLALTALLLGLVFYLLLTPLALVLRALGRDTLGRRLRPDTASYWEDLEQGEDPEQPFRLY